MSKNLQTVINAMRKAGAVATACPIAHPEEVSQIPAYWVPKLPLSDCRVFRDEYVPVLRGTNATLFQHFLPQREGGGRSYDELWLILDSSIELQRGILDHYAFDRGLKGNLIGHFSEVALEKFLNDEESLLATALTDRQNILALIAKETTPLIEKITPGMVIIGFGNRVSSSMLDTFFGEVISFMHKYDRFELTEKKWRKIILSGQSVIL